MKVAEKRYHHQLVDRQPIIDQLDASGWDREADKLRTCGKTVVQLICPAEHRKFAVPQTCRSRLCPECQRKQAAKTYHVMRRALREVKRRPGYRLGLLTLTFKKSIEADGLTGADMRRGFRCVRKLVREFFPRADGCGAIGVAEIGPSWNLHVHLIVFGPFVPQKELSDRWLEITGNSFVVDIRTVRRVEAVLYLLKHVRKLPVLPGERPYSILYEVLRGTRRLHTYGCFYNQLPLVDRDNPPLRCPFCGHKLEFDGYSGILSGLPRYWWWARRCRDPDSIPGDRWLAWQKAIGYGPAGLVPALVLNDSDSESYDGAFFVG